MNFTKLSRKPGQLPRSQRGAVTMFSAVLILILLTEVILYATQVGIFEQRKSANDVRQKQAFHAAETGLQHAKEFFLANAETLSQPATGGWMNAATSRWTLCTTEVTNAQIKSGTKGSHPCYGEAFPTDHERFDAFYNNMFFYGDGTSDVLPLNTDNLAGLAALNETVEVHALLCILDINRDVATGSPVVQGCTQAPPPGEHIYFMLTLLARGNAACADPTDITTCEAEALISERVGSYGPAVGDGGPNVPLTTRSIFPPGGTAELVPNSNAGGTGVAISAWVNGRTGDTQCPGDDVNAPPLDPNGASWSTCEPHEWYDVDAMPEDFACPTSQCSCGTDERRLTYSEGGEQIVGIDIVVDPLFPCDLFSATFGVEKTPANLASLAASIGIEIDDCGILDEDSGKVGSGIYWMTGDTCAIASNTVIGTKDHPVFLVSAAQRTKLSGGASLWGVLWVSDVLHADAQFESTGTNTIYGASVVDTGIDKFSGTFQIVYVDSVVRIASETGGIGKISGGWTDFHPNWE